MNTKIILLLILSASFAVQANANHMLGADMRYTYKGKDSFLISVDAYRDCKGVSMADLQISVAGIGCSYSALYNMTKTSCNDVTPVCEHMCTKCDRTNCNANGDPKGSNPNCGFPYGIEKITFEVLIVFPATLKATCCKFRVSMEQAYRSSGISTCCANENFFTYLELDRCIKNSSPVFENPNLIVCAGECVGLNLAGIDTVDNDSISYHIDKALVAFGTSATYGKTSGGIPYTYKTPLYYKGFPRPNPTPGWSCSGFLIDSIDGYISFTPDQQQFAQIVIVVKEWRYDSTKKKQVVIGLTRRDLPLIVVRNCTNYAPQVLGPFSKTVCAGDMVCFEDMKVTDQNSHDTVRVKWNYGIPKAVFTNKIIGKYEQWSLCWQTTENDASSNPYHFAVTAFDNPCLRSASNTRNFSITVSKQPRAVLAATDLGCGHVLLKARPVAGKSAYNEKELYQYEIPYPVGRIIGPSSQKDMDSLVVQFPHKGWNKYKFSMILNDCKTELLDSIKLVDFPSAALSTSDSACMGLLATIKAKLDKVTAPYTMYWNGQQSTSDSFQFISNGDTTIGFSLTDSTGCTFKDSITFYTKPDCQFQYATSGYAYYFRTKLTDTLPTYFWNFGDGNSSTNMRPQHTYATFGNYTVTLTVSNAKGCYDSCSQQVMIVNGMLSSSNTTNLQLYPNPTSSQSFLEFEDQKPATIKVCDLVGKCLWQSISQPNTGHHKININAPASGIYLISVSGSQGVYCLKWVIE